MRRFCIDSHYLGTSRHLLGDAEGYVWIDSVPRDAWHLTGQLKIAPTVRCLDTLTRLEGVSLPLPPEKFVTAMSQLITGSMHTIPWMHVMPQDQFRIFFKNLLSETTTNFARLPFDYYEIAWSAGSRVLTSLRSASIDLEKFQRATEALKCSTVPGFESFRPKKSGFAHPVKYDRFSTRTGRLTVSEGPNILLLRRDLRNVLKSTFHNGQIVSLDFRALEARVVLAEAGKYSGSIDMYDDIASELFGGQASRDTVKTAVIADLYGASRSSLKLRLNVSDDSIDTFMKRIRDYFKIDDLKRRLKEQASSTGKVFNRFGRPILIPQNGDNLLINSYAQSSGVDVAMLGFDHIIKELGNDGVRPLFVLHDAMILDVRGDRVQDVRSLTSTRIPTYNAPFPLKFDTL